MGERYAHDKRLVRERVEAERRGLSRADVVRLSAAACERIVTLPAFVRATRVVAYTALGNELDPAAAVAIARDAGKAVYQPDAGNDGPRFVGSTGPLVDVDDATVFLVPGVAFDVQGVRLGRGRGWYDRAFACHPAGIRVGLAYDFQVVPALPEAPWDVRMHAVVTESRVVGIRKEVRT